MYDMRFMIYDLGFTNDNFTGTIIGIEDFVGQKSNIVNQNKLRTKNLKQ